MSLFPLGDAHLAVKGGLRAGNYASGHVVASDPCHVFFLSVFLSFADADAKVIEPKRTLILVVHDQFRLEPPDAGIVATV